MRLSEVRKVHRERRHRGREELQLPVELNCARPGLSLWTVRAIYTGATIARHVEPEVLARLQRAWNWSGPLAPLRQGFLSGKSETQ